jgi:hypothetical protein
VITGWVLSKCDRTDQGLRPLVESLSVNHYGMVPPATDDGWALVHVACDSAHVGFMKKHPDLFIWIGSEWSKVPPEVLESHADLLDPNEQYQNMGQVLDKLADSEPRFHLRARVRGQ